MGELLPVGERMKFLYEIKGHSNFATRIFEIQRKRGYTVQDLQRLCREKVQPPRWYRFLDGSRHPTIIELKHIETKLGVLFEESDFEVTNHEGTAVNVGYHKAKQMEFKHKGAKR